MNTHHPPGPDDGPHGIKNAMRCKANIFSFLEELAEYGDLVFFQMGPKEFYLLNHQQFVRQAFLKNWQKLTKPEVLKASNRGYWGDGLTTLEGQAWRKRRRLMQPAFHQTRIEGFAQTIVDCTLDMLAGWQPGQIINIDQVMLTLTVRIACRIVFDAELEGFEEQTQQRSEIIPLEEAMGEGFRASQQIDRSTSASLARLRAGRKMEQTLNIMTRRLQTQEQRPDMLSFLLQTTYEDGSPMAKEELIGELFQMLFAGHHTIPSTLISLWYVLLQHPEVERKIEQELAHVLEGSPPDMKSLGDLSYCEMVVKETMRYYPPSILHLREVHQPFSVGDYTLKEGSMLWVSPYLLHRDERYFEEPERFWPERFSKAISKYAYIPFGAGPRLCIGHALSIMQMKLILVTIMQSYRLRLAPNQSIMPKMGSIMHPKKETYMQIMAHEYK